MNEDNCSENNSEYVYVTVVERENTDVYYEYYAA